MSVSSSTSTDSDDESFNLESDNSTFLQSILDSNSSPFSPRIPPEDRESSTEPSKKLMTTEYLQRCLGFRNTTSIVKALPSLTKGTITVRDTGRHPIL